MAWRSGSLSRTLLSNARRAPIRLSSSPSLAHGAVRPAPSTIFGNQRAPSPSPRLFSSTLLRNTEALGCTQSLLPLHSVVAATCLTSHLSVEARACCELSQGT